MKYCWFVNHAKNTRHIIKSSEDPSSASNECPFWIKVDISTTISKTSTTGSSEVFNKEERIRQALKEYHSQLPTAMGMDMLANPLKGGTKGNPTREYDRILDKIEAVEKKYNLELSDLTTEDEEGEDQSKDTLMDSNFNKRLGTMELKKAHTGRDTDQLRRLMTLLK